LTLVATGESYSEIMCLLIRYGAEVTNPQVTDENGYLPLHIACYEDSRRAVKALLEKGADINARGPRNESCLFVATRHGNRKLIEILLKRGLDINERNLDGQTPIFEAVINNHSPIAKRLFELKADITILDNFGRNVLFYAVEKATLHTTVRLLLESKLLSTEHKDKDGRKAIDYCTDPFIKHLFE
jgi:ankyrin repeat protein